MTWVARYCTSGTDDVADTEVEDSAELAIWVGQVNAERGVSGDIFSEKKYIDSATLMQWGTGYWWLIVASKTERGERHDVQVDRRPVPARVLAGRDRGQVHDDERQGEVHMPEGDRAVAGTCPTCGQEVTR